MPNRRFIPTGGLNKDVDKYNLPEGDYIDAKNVVFDVSVNGGGGSLKTFPNIESITDAAYGDLLGAGWAIKAAVSNNQGVIYTLAKDATNAVLGKIDTDDTFTPLLKYAHEVSSDFDPDIKVLGDVVIWNYHGSGTPLSWYVQRAANTAGSIALKDITLIKEPPKMEFTITPIIASAEPRDITLSATTFSEAATSGTTIASITVDDPTSATHILSVASALDNDGGDATSRFTIVGGNLQTVGLFDYGVSADRQFTVNISAENEGGLEYIEPFTITLINVAPSVTVADTSLNENTSGGTSVVTAVGLSGSAKANDDNCTYSITAGNTGSAFAIDSNTGEITVAGSLDHETTPSYTLTVQISDGFLTATDDTTITINDINEAPVANDQSISVNTPVPYIGTLTASDEDVPADTLTFSIVSGASNGVEVINNVTTGAFEYTPDGTVGSDSFTFKANDGSLDSNTATVTITVNQFNFSNETYGLINVTTDPDVSTVNISSGRVPYVGGDGLSNRVFNLVVTVTSTGATITPVDVAVSTTDIGADLTSTSVGTVTAVNSTTVNIPITVTSSVLYLETDTDLRFNFDVDLDGLAP